MSDWMVIAGAALGGGLLGVLVTRWRLRQSSQGSGDRDLVAVDFQHVVDLVRRVHGAQAACIITDDEIPTLSATNPRPAQDLIDRAVATARAAMEDGRDRVTHDVPEI